MWNGEDSSEVGQSRQWSKVEWGFEDSVREEAIERASLLHVTDNAVDGGLEDTVRARQTGVFRWAMLTACVSLILFFGMLTLKAFAIPHSHMAVAVTPVATSPAPSLQVDVGGDVHKPGVYTLQGNARVEDAVRAAGGFLHAADMEGVNLAQPLMDGQEVFIPRMSATAVPAVANRGVGTLVTSPSGLSTAPSSSLGNSSTHHQGRRLAKSKKTPLGLKIDLNTADAATLQTLPKIGPGRAREILAYRQSHGSFHSVSDLRNIRGIGPKIFADIAPYCVVQ
jgi:competence ComEA-like helix-hairpin-helix protein